MDNLENQAKAEALYKHAISLGISEGSIKDFQKVLEVNPRHILALWNLGCIYDGDYDTPGYGSYWDAFQCGDKYKAIECFTKIIEIDPKYIQAYIKMANNSSKEKRLQYYLQYLNLSPQDYKVIANIGWVYHQLNRKQQAIASFMKCIQHNEKDTCALDGLAHIYEQEGNYKDALKCLKKCIEINDKTADTYAHVGRIHDKMGDIKEAVNFYRKCNQLRYDHKQAQAYLKKHLNKR